MAITRHATRDSDDSDALKYAARIFGRRGGKARAKALTAQERREIARKAALARWSRRSTAK